MTAVAKLGASLSSLRQLHEEPRLIHFAATPAGKLVIWASATLLLPESTRLQVSSALALVLLFPGQREYWLVAGGAWLVLDRALPQSWLSATAPLVLLQASEALVTLLLASAAFGLARAWSPSAPFRRHALVAWHGLVWAGLALASLVTWTMEIPLIWPARAAINLLVWRIGYMLLSARRGSIRSSRFVDHALYCLPVWGGTGVPYGKGYDYLSRHRVHGEEDLAQSRLAGIKLLVLALLWRILSDLIEVAAHAEPELATRGALSAYTLGLPHLSDLLAANAETTLANAWLLVLLELIGVTLTIAITGHAIIGALRLFGYRVFRNTYRPLLSRSVVEFWNRFYYYFKELLVEFFFLPVYVRYFRSRPRLRIFAATMAAAFLGNVYFHLLRDAPYLAPAEVGVPLSSRAFYAFLLGIGVAISMTRERRRRGAPLPTPPSVSPVARMLRTARQIAGVWLFYSLIHIWNTPASEATFAERTLFFLGLFALR